MACCYVCSLQHHRKNKKIAMCHASFYRYRCFYIVKKFFFVPYKVKKVVKTTTTRTVIPSISDTLSIDGGGSMTGMPGYTTPMDRVYRPGGVMTMDYPTHTVPRNYHYGPPGGYDDYRAGPPSETYASLNRGARMDDRYRYNVCSNSCD